jgi:hypothetical protein
LVPHWYLGSPESARNPAPQAGCMSGPCWSRTSDLQLVELALSQLS